MAVDHWNVDDLRKQAGAAIEATGEDVDPDVFDRFAARLSYLPGDFTDDATYTKLATTIKGAKNPVFYLEIPPFLFGTVVKGLAEVGLTRTGRVVIEKPFGHDSASAQQLADDLHQYLDESQIYRIDHFLGKMGTGGTALPALRQHHSGAGLEPELRGVGADHHGGELRGGGSRPLLRRGRRPARRGGEPPPAGGRGRRHGTAGRHGPGHHQEPPGVAVAAVLPADPKQYVRGQYDGYQSIDGVAAGVHHRDVRGAAAGDRQLALVRGAVLHPHRQADAGHPDRVPAGVQGTAASSAWAGTPGPPEPDQLIVKLDPTTGIRYRLAARRAEGREPEPITLDMEFADQGGEAPTPYEVLIHAALVGNNARFTRQDGVAEQWRIMQPLLDKPPADPPVRAGHLGPGRRPTS